MFDCKGGGTGLPDIGGKCSLLDDRTAKCIVKKPL